MSKKLLAGILLGGAASIYAAWKKMAPAKKEALERKH